MKNRKQGQLIARTVETPLFPDALQGAVRKKDHPKPPGARRLHFFQPDTPDSESNLSSIPPAHARLQKTQGIISGRCTDNPRLTVFRERPDWFINHSLFSDDSLQETEQGLFFIKPSSAPLRM
jgi:hypothetical protein